MKKRIISLALLSILPLISACSSSGGGAGSPSSSDDSLDKSVTVERGKVFAAVVKDSSTPAQVAAVTYNSNVYTFTKPPVFPIKVSGGYIDVNNDGIITTADVFLDMNMSSYSNLVTPISTYLALDENATLREQKLNALVLMLQELDANSTVSAGDLLKLPSKSKAEVALVANAIFAKYENSGDNFAVLSKTSIKSQFEALKTFLLQTNIQMGDENFFQYAEEAIMSDMVNNNKVNKPSQGDIDTYKREYGGSENNETNATHTFQEGLSLDISSGLIGNSVISLFKNDNSSTEMLFTLGKDKTATIQYVQNHEAIWQNTSYVYSISGNTITCTLPVGGGINIGQEAAPMQVVLELGNSNITAHISATINKTAYTVFSAFGDKYVPNTTGTWIATPLSAPLTDLIISSDGKTIVGSTLDFSLHTYDVGTKATTDLVTDTSGNVVRCMSNNNNGRDVVQIDESKIKYSFICANTVRDQGLDNYSDQIYFYNSTTDTYKLISSSSLTNGNDAESLFMNFDATKIIYKTHLDAGDSILEYDMSKDTTGISKTDPYGLKLLDADRSLNTRVYISNEYMGGHTHQQLVVAHNAVETGIEDFTQDLADSIQIIDARVSRDGTKVIYITGNMYDSARSSLRSLYMYDVVTATKTTLEENFSNLNANHSEWGISNDASTIVFSMNAAWGTETLESQTYIYTFDVAAKTHKEIYKGSVEGVLVSPEATSIYTTDKTTMHLLKLSAQ